MTSCDDSINQLLSQSIVLTQQRFYFYIFITPICNSVLGASTIVFNTILSTNWFSKLCHEFSQFANLFHLKPFVSLCQSRKYFNLSAKNKTNISFEKSSIITKLESLSPRFTILEIQISSYGEFPTAKRWKQYFQI